MLTKSTSKMMELSSRNSSRTGQGEMTGVNLNPNQQLESSVTEDERRSNSNASRNQQRDGFRVSPQQELSDTRHLSRRLHLAQVEWKKMLNAKDSRVQERGIPRLTVLTVANARNNRPWGDELQEKGEGIFRVYSQNVNGFRLDRRGGNFDSYCAIMREVQADVLCGQEHNLDTTQPAVRSILFATAQQHWQRSRLAFGTTPIGFVNMYKPGGTFQMTVDNATSRVVDQSTDKWGRWVSQTFQGKANRRVTIISAYQVVTDIAPSGSITTATQQRSLLLQAQDKITQPRAAFRRDLLQYLTTLRTSGQ